MKKRPGPVQAEFPKKRSVDSASISLNSTDPDEYRKLMGTPNGKQWDSMLEFAKRAKEYVPKVYMSVVGVDGLDVESAKEFVEKKIGAEFRFRPLF